MTSVTHPPRLKPLPAPGSVYAVRGDRAGRLQLACAVLLTAIALALRLADIGHESFWLDEGYTLFFSRLPLKQLILIGGAHEHPPVYYLVVHALFALHGSYLAPRYVSAVAGGLSVLLIYLLGRAMFAPAAGLAAALLVTVSPFHIWMGRDARAYELAGLFVLASYLALVHALAGGRRLWWPAFALCSALALYTEYTTIFVLLPQAVYLVRAHRHHMLRQMLASCGLVLLLLAPWLGILARDAAGIASDYWIPPPTWVGVQNTVIEFLGLVVPCPNYPCVGPQAPIPGITGHGSVIAAIAIALVLAALPLVSRAGRLDASVAALWAIVPFALVFAIATRRSLYIDRVFLDATFGFYLLIGAAVARAGRLAWPAILLVILLTGGGIANATLIYSRQSNPDFRSLAHDLGSAYRPGDVVVYNPAVLQSVVHAYLPPPWHPTREQMLWFHGYLDIPSWGPRYIPVREHIVHDQALNPQLRYSVFDDILRHNQLAHAARGAKRIWLVTQDYGGLSDARRWFETHGFHLLMSELYFGGTRLELWDRGLPSEIGPAVVAQGGAGWTLSGRAAVRGAVFQTTGTAEARKTFAVSPGVLYVVNVEYQAFPGSFPSIHAWTYNQAGQNVGQTTDRVGRPLTSFPRTEWYDMPANGTWITQPFGFVAPPGSTHATLILANAGGPTYWRNIAVYRRR